MLGISFGFGKMSDFVGSFMSVLEMESKILFFFITFEFKPALYYLATFVFLPFPFLSFPFLLLSSFDEGFDLGRRGEERYYGGASCPSPFSPFCFLH
jgi:hypothetical protein